MLPPFYEASIDGSLRQGEILTNLVIAYLPLTSIDAEAPEVEFETHPYAVLLSQDCDLEQDWNVRTDSQPTPAARNRLVPFVLLGQVVIADQLKGQVDPRFWEKVQQNKEERYHFLRAVPAESDALGEGLPALGIDFKRFFALRTEEVYHRVSTGVSRRRCRLATPYAEHLSMRFFYYQFRVALPWDHHRPGEPAAPIATPVAAPGAAPAPHTEPPE